MLVDLDPGKKKELAKQLDKQISDADLVRQPFESDWYSNCLFLAGDQDNEAHKDLRRFRKVPIKYPDVKVKMHVNQIISLTRQAASSMRFNLGQQIGVPATNDPEDVDSAAVTTDLLRYRYDQDKEAELTFNEIMWSLVAGRAARKTMWNPNKDSNLVTGKVRGAGDIDTTTMSPFQFHVSPWTDCMTAPAWVAMSIALHVDEINDLYPGHDVKPEEVAYATQFIEKLMFSIVQQKMSQPAQKKSAVLKTMWIAPNFKNPNGKLYVWANGEMLDEQELPDGLFPIVFLDWFTIPGSTYPLPFITPLRDPQKHTNITWSQLIELKNRQLRGDMMTRGLGKVHEEFLESGAKHIRLDPGLTDMQLMQYQLNPNEGEVILSRLWNESMQIAGIHEYTNGQNASSVDTATQAQLSREADLAGLTLFRAGFDLRYAVVGGHKKLIAQKHYAVPRMISVTGMDNSVRVRSFFGSDLKGTADVRTKAVPMVTEAIRMQMRREAAIAGLQGPFQSPQDMLAKILALQDSGIPDIDERISKLIYPLTSMDELFELCGQTNALQFQAMMATLKAQIEQVQMQSAMGQVQMAQAASAMQGGESVDGTGGGQPVQ